MTTEEEEKKDVADGSAPDKDGGIIEEEVK